jgi:hypothetical protein
MTGRGSAADPAAARRRAEPEARAPGRDEARAAPTAPAQGRGPILVTGSHRSGSTWVGAVLALAPGTGYVHEPFNTKTRAGICDLRFPSDFFQVTRATEAAYLPALRDTLAWRYALAAEARSLRSPRDALRMLRDFAYFETRRRRGDRVVMKDPLALFSAEWLAETFDMPVVVLIRHPAAFAASLIAAGWTNFRFETLLAQEGLMRDRLAPFRAEVAAAAAARPAPLEVAILLWRLIHHHIRLLARDQPDWIFLRHEDLSRDPAPAFREVFRRLGLPFDAGTAARIAAMSAQDGGRAALSIFGTRRRVVRNSRDAVAQFRRRLDAAEIARVREGAADVWPAFYGEGDW